MALLGAGAQGQVLLDAMLRIPGLRFRAVCDIWTEYNQKRAVNTLQKYKFEVNGYEDYREMLDKEKDLDAVVIATPDFWHAPHTVDCLKAGKHVYCEKEMSNTLEGARSMVLAARETGKLLQIGHQRRSHPRYLHCHEKLLEEARLLGRIVTVNGQWNRAVSPDLGWPERYAIPADAAEAVRLRLDARSSATGAGTRARAAGRSWTSARTRSTSSTGSWARTPSHVMASGGTDYHDRDDARVVRHRDGDLRVRDEGGPGARLLPDPDHERQPGLLRELHGRPGHAGHLRVGGEQPGPALPRSQRPRLGRVDPKGYVSAPKLQEIEQEDEPRRCWTCASRSRPTSTGCRSCCATPTTSRTCRTSSTPSAGTATLNCPAEVGYETAVTVLKVNEAIDAKQRLSFRPEDFRV